MSEQATLPAEFPEPVPSPFLAWDTEDAAAVVWGTHDPETAHAVYLNWLLTEMNNSPEEADETAPDVEDWANAHLEWIDPAALETDGEVFPEAMVSHTPVDGWVPVMVAIA